MGRRLWSSPRFCVMQDAYASALAGMNGSHRHCYGAQSLRHCGFFLRVTAFPCNRGQLFRLEGLCVLRRAEKPFLCLCVLYVHTRERFCCAVRVKSRDAKSCVSQAGICFCYLRCVVCWCRYWLDGRRKILRLYRLAPLFFLNEKHHTYSCTGSSPLSAPRALYASDSISPSPGITVTGARNSVWLLSLSTQYVL